MKKYYVYGIMAASVLVGTYQANSKEEAIEMANNDNNGNWVPTICHQCSREIELGDVYETYAEESE